MSLAVEFSVSFEVLILQVCFLGKYVSETLSELCEFLISTNKLKEMPLNLTYDHTSHFPYLHQIQKGGIL